MRRLLKVLDTMQQQLQPDPEGLAFAQFMVKQGDASHLATDFDENGWPTPAGLAGGERFIAHARNWTPVAWWLWDKWNRLQGLWPAIHCDLTDHILEDHSSFGPDSGSEHLH